MCNKIPSLDARERALSMKASEKSIELADETLRHFSDIKKSSNISLIVSSGLALITIIILVVQTYTPQHAQLECIRQQDTLEIQLKEKITSDIHLLNLQLDSLKDEFQKLKMTSNLTSDSILNN